MDLLILDDVSEHDYNGRLIPNEIVIDDEHLFHVLNTQTVQFRQDLRTRFDSRETSKGYDDVTKFAEEGTPPGDLNARIEIVVHFEQIKAWRGYAGHIRFCALLIASFPPTQLPIM